MPDDTLTLAVILDKMDARTAQIAELIRGHTLALENIARMTDAINQSLVAIQQRQVFALELLARSGEVSAQALRVSAEILARMGTR